jgi:putative FmdB family regulatory protein
MPVYAFSCEHCGPFEVRRPLREATEPAHCPACEELGRRIYTPPGLVRTPAPVRRARDLEEKSAHEPELVGRPHGSPLSWHGSHTPKPPWVLGH